MKILSSRASNVSALLLLALKVAKLIKTFGSLARAESLDDFGYMTNRNF